MPREQINRKTIRRTRHSGVVQVNTTVSAPQPVIKHVNRARIPRRGGIVVLANTSGINKTPVIYGTGLMRTHAAAVKRLNPPVSEPEP